MQAELQGDERYEDWKGWAESDFGRCSGYDAAYFRVEVLDRLAPSSGQQLLEVGFGNGGFMGCAKRWGHSVTGLELNPVLRRRAAASGFEVRDSSFALATDAFDAAVAFDVLEHVPHEEIVGFLRELRRCVKPGGLIILRFPNGDSPFGRAHQYGDVTHVSVIGSAKLGYFAKAAQLRLVALHNQAVPMRDVRLRKKLSGAVRHVVQGSLERLIGWTFYGARRPLAQNVVAVLRKPDV